MSCGGTDERITVKLSSTKVGANSNIGVGTFLAEKRDPSFVGVLEPDASESKKLVVATDQRRRNDRSRQARCVTTTHNGNIHIRTGGDAEVAKTYRGR
jgi:hypothetical protein